MTFGTLLRFALPGGILLFSTLLGGSSPMNPAAFTLFLLPLSLSWDHRVIDGAAAARFTTHLAGVLTDLKRALL